MDVFFLGVFMQIKKFIYEYPISSSIILSIAGFGLLQIFALFVGFIISFTDYASNYNNKSLISAIMEIVYGIVFAFLFCVFFRKEFKIKILPKDFSDSKFYTHYFISFIVVTIPLDFSFCYFGFHSTWFAFLTGLAAGLAEEVICRFIPVSILMASEKTRDKKNLIVFVSSIPFALMHCFNAIAGADFKYTIVQVIFAFGFGVLFAAIYLVSGNIFFSIFMHFAYDYIALAISGGTGLVTSQDVGEITIVTFIVEIFIASIYIFLSRMFMNRWNLVSTNEMWQKIWIKPIYVKQEASVDESCYEFSSSQLDNKLCVDETIKDKDGSSNS